MASMHPLEPLTADEISAAARIVRASGHVSENVRFGYTTLFEPPKDIVYAFDAGALGAPVERLARCVVIDKADGISREITASLTHGQVSIVRKMDGEQAPILMEEFDAGQAILRADPRFREALAKRGIENVDLVQIDPWPAGHFGSERDVARTRMNRAVTYVRETPDDNGYARPIEGIVAEIDQTTGTIADFQDHGAVPLPPTSGRYDARSVGALRTGLRPIEITQPEGPSFDVDGHEVRWQRWRFRISVHPIEGLVLHTVGYEDPARGARVRPIMYRASLAEMVVPYGDTSPMHWWKNAFDAGEVGIGRCLNSLTLGCDCVGEIHYFDVPVTSDSGEPETIANAICMHEEDYGILWKHTDVRAGTTEVRRSRRLVVSCVATVGNYEYGFFWYFYLDGTLQHEVKLTGILQTSAVADDDPLPHAILVAPNLAAPHHQHLFCFRLDMDVDGPANTVYEMDVVADPPGPTNEYNNTFRVEATPLRSELAAQRLADPGKSRTWLIVNEAVRNGLGQPTAFRLLPGPGQILLAGDTAAVTARAGFARKNLWVTQASDEERHPGGNYPNQHPGGEGLPVWTAADRPLEDQDVVLWHVFSSTHVARPEDWPVMPVEYTGFTLKPVGFFDRNPALDVPPSTNGHCRPA